MKFRLIYKPSTMGSGPLFNSIQEKIIAFRQEEQNLWSITFQNSQTFEQRCKISGCILTWRSKQNWNLKLGSQTHKFEYYISCPV